jgi:SSS family solute:Na+ symporter
MNLRPLDLGIVCAYLAATLALGAYFVRRNRDPERFMSAGRTQPGWAVGLSIFGSFVSSISFLAVPGKAFAGNWNPFVFSLTLPLAAWIATRWFVPFYRRLGEVSSYEHLERRFGAWARTYAVVSYLLIQLARSGTIMYLLAIAMQPLTGWPLWRIIVLTGLLMTVFPMLGGTEGVIWTGALQSVVLAGGALTCAAVLLFGMPQGPAQIFTVAQQHDKWSLGSFHFDFASPTVWVVLLYAIAINLTNFGVDQGYVQRYITAKSDRAAKNSVWLGAMLYIPISACFFFIGTALYAFYAVHGGLPPDIASTPDKVFPYFIDAQLPAGVRGLIVAAIFAAATDSNFNSTSTLIHCDLYKRYFRPAATARESIWVLRIATVAFGLLCTGAAMWMITAKTVLDLWWEAAGVISGGMLGLFLLGRLSRAGRNAAIIGVLAGVSVMLWMVFGARLGLGKSPLHALMIGVVGTGVVLGVGSIAGMLTREKVTQRVKETVAAK